MNAKTLLSTAKLAVQKHSPEILIAVGLAGAVTSVVLAVRQTPKALKAIEKAKEEKGEELSKFETVKVAWKYYIPAGTTMLVGVLCICGAHKIDIGRNAAIMTAYSLSNDALKEYTEKNVELFGKEADDKVKEAIVQDKIDNSRVPDNMDLGQPSDELCYDTITGRYFMSTEAKMLLAAERLNKVIRVDDVVSLNDLYFELGTIEPVEPIGDFLGWNIASGDIQLNITAKKAPNGKSCLVMGFRNAPFYGYNDIEYLPCHNYLHAG